MRPDLKRHELEDYAEEGLIEIAQTLIPPEPEEEDLKAAKDFFPSFFGGLFPTLGLAVMRTQGRSRYADKRDRPGLLIAQVLIYHPCLPMRGAKHAQDDRTGKAKRITRRIRGRFLEAVFASSEFGPYIEVAESRGSPFDETGTPITEELGRNDRQILWADGTELHISA